MAYSKGKWSINKAHSGNTYIYAESHQSPIGRPLKQLGRLSNEEFEANALLMADGPRLLRMINELVEMHKGNSKFSEEMIMRKAEQLLAKHKYES